MDSLTPQLFLPVYPHANVDHQPPSCSSSSPPQLLVYAPPASPDEIFFFNSLVFGLPYSLNFWQFLLTFVFKFVVVLFLVVQGGIVYVSTPPYWPETQKIKYFFKRAIIVFFFFIFAGPYTALSE